MGFKTKNKNRNKKKKNKQNTERIDQNELSQEKSKEFDDEVRRIELNDESGPSNVQKRHHDCNDSDEDESKPKRKKKKKQHITENLNKKDKKSIRQMKREKFAQRQAESQAAAKDHLKTQCLNYLSQWKHDKTNWKFMKAKQVWLYKNKFSSLLPDSSWPLLLEYFESAQGNIRKMILDDAKKIIKQMDEWTESRTTEQTEECEQNNENGEADTQNRKPDDNVYKRARDLIQCLEE